MMKKSHHWRDNCPGRTTSPSSTRANGLKSASFTSTRLSGKNGAASELERQFKTALFGRTVLHPVKVTPVVAQTHPDALSVFKDSYLVEFLDLQPGHLEADLHQGLLQQLKNFLIELGRDFCFVGSEFPLQVGGRDFALDLLFFHQGLNCLVAIELKVGRFEPEYLGKLSFYLEALDRDVKKPHEQAAIGVLLCASKDEEVVIRAQPQPVPGADCRLSDAVAGQGAAAGQAARAVCAQCGGRCGRGQGFLRKAAQFFGKCSGPK